MGDLSACTCTCHCCDSEDSLPRLDPSKVFILMSQDGVTRRDSPLAGESLDEDLLHSLVACHGEQPHQRPKLMSDVMRSGWPDISHTCERAKAEPEASALIGLSTSKVRSALSSCSFPISSSLQSNVENRPGRNRMCSNASQSSAGN